MTSSLFNNETNQIKILRVVVVVVLVVVGGGVVVVVVVVGFFVVVVVVASLKRFSMMLASTNQKARFEHRYENFPYWFHPNLCFICYC